MRKALERAGFGQVKFLQGTYFVVEAEKLHSTVRKASEQVELAHVA